MAVEVDEESDVALHACALEHLFHVEDGRMQDFGRGLPRAVPEVESALDTCM